MENIDFLFSLIKFNMEQIQSYKEGIILISISLSTASFAVSAFLYQERTILIGSPFLLITLSNFFIILLLAFTAYTYNSGLNLTRKTLEIQETALEDYLKNNASIIYNHLYPTPDDIKNHTLKMTCRLEKFPIFFALFTIVIKAILEFTFYCIQRNKDRIAINNSIHNKPETNGLKQ